MSAETPSDLPYRPCVGVMLINAEGRIFAGQRIDTPAPAWQMPQGGVDDGETPRAAALRELEEETGVTPDMVEEVAETPGWLSYDLPADLQPRVWGGQYRGQKQRWFLLRYTGRDDQITLETDHPEFSAWRWMSANELIDAIVPFKRPIYEKVVEIFRPYLA